MTDPTGHPAIVEALTTQRYRLLFATISGAHLYGFPSPDSDFDVRGVHVLPVPEIVGLDSGHETIEASTIQDGVQVDLVTHDVNKFFLLLLKRNGYVLEQLYSPLLVSGTPEYAELRHIARGFITRHHAHHYFGFSRTQWRLFEKEQPHRVKPLLYVFRVLLTGIHLMRTGRIEANVLHLNEEFRLPYLPDLVARKLTGSEQVVLGDETAFYQGEYERLSHELELAYAESTLPEGPSGRAALNALLVRIRLAQDDNTSRRV